VVLGRGSRPEIEVNAEAIEEDGVPLLKRRGGGCSVVLDTGNVIVSTTLPLSGFGGIPRAFSWISEWVIEALNRAGVKDVRHAGISDLVLGDRKIGGACIYRTRDLLYYSTTLLFDPSLDLIERYLKHPPREPEYRAGRAHRAFLGSLLGRASVPDISLFTEHIDHTLRDTLETLMGLENAANNTQEVSA
jgi:lipoate-protein ligase A